MARAVDGDHLVVLELVPAPTHGGLVLEEQDPNSTDHARQDRRAQLYAFIVGSGRRPPSCAADGSVAPPPPPPLSSGTGAPCSAVGVDALKKRRDVSMRRREQLPSSIASTSHTTYRNRRKLIEPAGRDPHDDPGLQQYFGLNDEGKKKTETSSQTSLISVDIS